MDHEISATGIAMTQQDRIAALRAKLHSEQNLPLGMVAGAVAGIVGALIWMGITVVTGYHVGYVAIGIGAAVGYAVRYAGKGTTKLFGVVGAVMTLLACVLGEVLAEIQLAASAQGMGFLQALPLVDVSNLVSSVVTGSSPITYLIYGIGIFEGYKLSLRKVTAAELHEAGLGQAPV